MGKWKGVGVAGRELSAGKGYPGGQKLFQEASGSSRGVGSLRGSQEAVTECADIVGGAVRLLVVQKGRL